MIANETMVGKNKLQNLLFPLEYMYITQGENGSYSHQGDYSMDFSGWGASGVITRCPYYAPCDCTLVAKFGTASLVWQSDKKVNYIDGSIDYATIGFTHDNDFANFNVGDTRKQGEVIGHTGTQGHVTGDHVHFSLGRGTYTGYMQNSSGVWVLKNQEHLYLMSGVNDTILSHPLSYNWLTFIPYKPSKDVTIKKKSIIPLCLCNALKGVIKP